VTALGDLDLMGEVPGGGTFEELVEHSEWIQVLGIDVRCVDLRTLIRLEKAAGRPKDLEALAEVEAILDELAGEPSPDQTG
jgi:predicted nucleotidyltransferase